jgi:transposase
MGFCPTFLFPSIAFPTRQNKIPNPVNGWPDFVWFQFMREKMVHVGTVDAIQLQITEAIKALSLLIALERPSTTAQPLDLVGRGLAHMGSFWVLPRGKQKARSASQRLKIAKLNYSGHSNAQIAQTLSISTETVERALRHFIQTDSRYPTGLDASKVELMRAEELANLEHYKRQIALRISRLTEPTTFSQEIDAIATVAAVSAAYTKISENQLSPADIEAKEAAGLL